MRKLMAIAMVVLFAGATSSWALFGLEDVNFDGSIEVKGNSANNEADFASSGSGTGADNDYRGGTNTRVTLGMNMTVTENVQGRLGLVRNTRRYGSGATTIQNEADAFRFENAYIDFVELFGLRKIRLGRQYVGEPGDLVWNIGLADDDFLSASGIDGILFDGGWMEDMLEVSLFMGKAVEDDTINGNTVTTDTDLTDNGGDQNLNSLDINVNVIPEGRVRLGYLNGTDHNTTVRGDNNNLQTYRLGVDGALMENMLTYRLEFLQNAGQFNEQGTTGAGATTDLDYKGNAIDLGLGANIGTENSGKFGIVFDWISASGDDNVTDDKDDSFHDFTPIAGNTSDRYMGEIFGKSNVLSGNGQLAPLGQGVNSSDVTGTVNNGTQGPGIQAIRLGASWHAGEGILEKSWISLDYWMFSRSEDDIKTAANTQTKIGDDYGSEIDIIIGYDPSENVMLEFGFATLDPDDALIYQRYDGNAATIPLPAGVPSDAVTKWFANATVKWGGEEE